MSHHISSDKTALAGFDVVLAPTSAEAAALGRELALQGGILSCLICSTDSWVERLWELAGDGRHFVDGVTRALTMNLALEGRDALSGPHLPALLAQRMRDAAGTPQLTAALAAVRSGDVPSDLLPSELEILRACAAYEDRLASLGCIERGVALAHLTQHLNEVFPQRIRVAYLASAPLDTRLQTLLVAAEEAGCLELSYLESERFKLRRAPEQVSLRFAFPSGRYATPQLALKLIDELAAQGPVLISTKDPIKLFEALEPAYVARGLKLAARGSIPLANTLLGRLISSLISCLDGGELSWDKAALTDALANSLVHASLPERASYDLVLRENSLLARSDAYMMLPSVECITALSAFIAQPSRKTLACARHAIAKSVALPPHEQDQLNAGFEVFEKLVHTYEILSIPCCSLRDALTGPLASSQLSVRYTNAKLPAGTYPDVLIESMAQAAVEPQEAFATVLVLDLDADSYPAARKDGAIDLLMSRLGVPQTETPIERQRRQLAALVTLPTHSLVLGRCLTNSKADPTYPAAVLEEFVDLYREDTTRFDDIDNIYALPEELQAGLFTCGEEALEADVWPGIQRVAAIRVQEPLRTSLFNQAALSVEGAFLLRLSPAQIEAYLDCPRKWFYSRKLGASALDEVLGPRELGLFRHDTLQRFYELFRSEGQMKVCSHNLKQAQEVLVRAMDEVYASYLQLDDSGRPLKALNRCVAPLGTSGAHTIQQVREELLEWLSFEAAFLPGPADAEGSSPFAYAPRAFELSLDEYDVSFAGAKIIGRIDRVDVSLDGSNFVVVDYKGGVGTSYTPVLNEGELVLPTKIQALIYAAAIARTPALQEALGLTRGGVESIAGAIYVSYLRRHAIRGTFTDKLSRERHLPTLPSKAQPLSSDELAELLDELERVVATQVVEPLLAGNTEPLPLKNACTYCPAQCCPRRGCADAS